MATGVISWSQTAATNASADATINWAEGQAPSTVNDSARALMASMAKYRDDYSGVLNTAGSAGAYTLTTYQGFPSLAAMSGCSIAVRFNVTNTDSPTLNVDGLGAKPIYMGYQVTQMPAGTLIAATPYHLFYDNNLGYWMLHNTFAANPYQIPIAASIDYWGLTAPNSCFALCYGQAISRTTYATLFSIIGTGYGAGDGSTTFNLPDLRGRVIAGADNMGGVGAGRMSTATLNSAALGGVGGAETTTLITANLPPYTPSGTVSTSVAISAQNLNVGAGGTAVMVATGSISASSTFNGSTQGGTSQPIANNQPTIMGNKLIRVI